MINHIRINTVIIHIRGASTKPNKKDSTLVCNIGNGSPDIIQPVIQANVK